MRKLYLIIGSVILGLSASADNWENLAKQVETALIDYRDLGGSYAVRSSEKDNITVLDKEFSKEVCGYFCGKGPNKPHVIPTDPPIEFREYPTNTTTALRLSFQLNEDRTLFVNYRRYKVDEKVDLYICENSFWNDRKQEGRINASTYGFFTGEEGKRVDFLADSSTSRYSEIGSPQLPDIFLGFISNEKGKVPHVAFLTGPAGSGSFWRIRIYSYDQKNEKWMQADVYDNSGLKEYSYDEKTTNFSYKQYGEELDSYSISIEELVNKYGYFSDLSKEQRAGVVEFGRYEN